MKVGLIYTSTTPELIELVEQEVKGQLGEDVELYSLQDPSILADVREAGYVTTAPAARLIGMYMQAAQAIAVWKRMRPIITRNFRFRLTKSWIPCSKSWFRRRADSLRTSKNFSAFSRRRQAT